MYAQTRSKLTQADREFIADTLGRSRKEKLAIRRLTDDPFALTEILHEKRLFDRSMTVPPHLLPISTQLFFYIFIHRALEHKKIANDDVVDYVAWVCVEFRTEEILWQFSQKSDEKMVYIVDLLDFIGKLDRSQQYYLRRYIGNVSLFLTSFFPDFIFKRSREKGAPPLSYYENVGRSQYETASEEALKYESEAEPVFKLLAARFIEIRSALNVFTDAYLHVTNNKHSFDKIRRQVSTLDEESLRQSFDL